MRNKSDNSFEKNESSFGTGKYRHPDVLTPDEIFSNTSEETLPNRALEELRKKVTSAAASTEQNEEKKPETVSFATEKTLLDKCLPYILDDDGNDTSQNKEPLYKLQSVAEILKNDSKKALERLSKEYGVSFEADISNVTVEDEVSPKDPYEPQDTEADSEVTTEAEENSLHVISDIDISSSAFYKADSNEREAEQTLTFTPVVQDNAKSTVLVTSHTRPINFTGELLKLSEPQTAENEELQLEKSDFEEFTPKKEYTDLASGKELLTVLRKTARNRLLSMLVSITLTLTTAFFMLPFMSNTLLTNTRACMIVTTAFTLLSILSNLNIFLRLGGLISSSADSGATVALAAIGVLGYSICGIIEGEIILNLQVLMLLILSFNAIKEFICASTKLRSFKLIFNNTQKHGVALINDPAITLAMTKGSVEGNCLLAAPQRTDKIDDFMKYFDYGTFLNGKMGIIAIISLILAILSGIFAAMLFDGMLYGFYCAAAILCFAALPVSLLIDVLPLYDASKKLASKGAILTGKTGAEMIEQANAVVINAKDIFPSGTVTLHQIKVLSDNNIEDTLIRAASLTEAMQSPLTPIFKRIAGNSNITAFPDSDTVKYEEALGISGWVDNRLLFIGNRTLMEAHGITVPDVEIDRKILRQGFFPVYVASGNKACALLIVRYDIDPNVAKELRQLTNSGVTVLIKTSDPNITEAMVCDYLRLYEDSVKVMTAAGCHIYVNTVLPVKSFSAPAAFKANPTALPAILNCAGRFKRSNTILTAAYIIAAVFGILLFSYSSFGGSGSLMGDTALLLYGIVSTVISYLIYLTQKP